MARGHLSKASDSGEASEPVVRTVRGQRRVIRLRFAARLQVIRWRFVAPLLVLVFGPPVALLLDNEPRGALIAGMISVAAAIFGYKDFAEHSLRDRG